MKILVVSAYLPWCGHGGGLLVGNLLRQLKKRHEVTVVSFVDAGEEKHVSEVAALCDCLKTVPLHRPDNRPALPHDTPWCIVRPAGQGRLRRAWGRLPASTRRAIYPVRRIPGRIHELRQAVWPEEIALRQTPEFRETLSRTVEEADFDVVLAEWPEMAPYRPHLPARAVKVFDSYELRSVTYRRRILARRSVDAWLFWFCQWRKMREVEALATREFDIVTAVSRKEARALERYGGNALIAVNPSGLDLTNWPREDSVPRRQETLVFLGRMSYGPNQDAVRYFLAQIYPRIRAEIPGVGFTVVGGDPPDDIAAYHGRDGVSVLGFVPDVREHLVRGTVFVLPMRQGAGIKVKAMEAMAGGIPIVSTPEGVEGLDHIDPGREVMVADSPQGFANMTVALLKDAGLRGRMAERARRATWEHYDSAANTERLEQLYLAQVQRRRARP